MKALVFGAGGFIGSHLVRRLKSEGYYVTGVDLKVPDFSESAADEFVIGDLRDPAVVQSALEGGGDELYQLAAEMGGAGFIFTGDNDAEILHNSALINLNTAKFATNAGIPLLFYSSSACVYPRSSQNDPARPDCREDAVYPADPDSDYGWEKLFSERMFAAFGRNHSVRVKIARFHNVYGPEGTWTGGKEKAPAAICRKIAMAANGSSIDIWGDGRQTRSFLFITDCLDAVRTFMKSKFDGPLNIGSEELISIEEFARLVIRISGKELSVNHCNGPTGVRGRKSDNSLMREELRWEPRVPLKEGISLTYRWIQEQVTVRSERYLPS